MVIRRKHGKQRHNQACCFKSIIFFKPKFQASVLNSITCRRYSVVDVLQLLFPGNSDSHARTTWGRHKDDFQGPEFSTYRFPGERQRDTPVATLEGVLKIIDHFDTPVARQLKAPQREIFMRAMRGEPINHANAHQPDDLHQNYHLMAVTAAAMQDIAKLLTAKVPAMEQKMEGLLDSNVELQIAKAVAETEIRALKVELLDTKTINLKLQEDLTASQNHAMEMEVEMRGLKRRCEKLEETEKENISLKANQAKIRRVEEMLDRSKLSAVIHRVTGRWPGRELGSMAFALQETYKAVFEEAPHKLERGGYMSNAYFPEQMEWVEDFVRDWYAKK